MGGAPYLTETVDIPFPQFSADGKRVNELFAKVIAQKLEDYRIKITPSQTGFTLGVKGLPAQVESPPPGSDANDPKRGPRSFTFCLSCEPEKASIAECNYEGGEEKRGPPGGLPANLRRLTASNCLLKHYPQLTTAFTDSWLDAQARPLIIVTPKRHVGGMEEMNETEIADVWCVVGSVIKQFGGSGPEPRFKEIVLNAGKFRNIAHAHVKVWFEDEPFLDQVERCWSTDERTLFEQLHELRRLMKLPREDALRKEIGGDLTNVRMFVKGTFRSHDRTELLSKFSQFGAVSNVELLGVDGTEGAVVSMQHGEDAIQAIIALNLTRFGRNIMCKVKVAAGLK
ncbi:hypothetical protein HDU79_002007 [Rhizoclosmatium sp. JEL0117]|nr:hypothetical protein HDU79_002007 [Rhizoclosmatium sp. JEL0117]